ncbi:hypothetical protein LPJ59_007063, partial [Coemansia sp. RSA 2399]
DNGQGADAHISLETVMNAMDRELGESKVGQSFVRGARQGSANSDDSTDEHSMDEIPDVDIDLNLVENIVESFRAQEGLSGPAGTMLGQFGIHLPRMEADTNDGDDDNDDDKRTDSTKQ